MCIRDSTRSDYEPDFYDYLNWIEENATSGFYQIIYRWLVDEEFDDDLNLSLLHIFSFIVSMRICLGGVVSGC